MENETRQKKTQAWLLLLVLTLAGVLTACVSESTNEKVVRQDRVSAEPDHEPADHETAGHQIADHDIKNRPVEKKDRGYISSDSCRECHAHHYETWHASHHRTMTQVPSEDSVIADFDNKVLVHSGREFRFFHDGDDYFMEMKSLPGTGTGDSKQNKTFKIVLMTGAHHQQGFWCESGRGRTLTKIPFIWITKEQRWVPYGSIFFLPGSRLSMHVGIWNSNCIKCHVVGGQPRQEQEHRFDTHVAEFGISCEACHGPGEAHAAFQNDLLDADPEHPPIGKQEMINPDDLTHVRSSQTCGQCHSVFDFYDDDGKSNFMTREGFPFRPGDNLLDSRHVFQFGQDEDLPIVKQRLKRDPEFWQHQFWSDGMVRVSGREYNGLLETPCHQRGKMSCLSCHDMHPDKNDGRPVSQWANDQMKLDMRSNNACLQCHQDYKSDEKLAAHTHHSAGSSGSNCYNCHMPHTTLGLMKAMRSHTIDSPNAATTVTTGRPNACNLCHLDKTLAWTAEHLEQWYGTPAPKLSEEEKEVASSIRWILKGDAGQRAIAGWHFGWAPAQKASGTRWIAPYMAELLTDTYDVVRLIGHHSLRDMPGFSDFNYDFVGSEQARELGRTKALKLWNESDSKASPSRALLINEQNELIEKAIRMMREQRLDPPIKLVE